MYAGVEQHVTGNQVTHGRFRRAKSKAFAAQRGDIGHTAICVGYQIAVKYRPAVDFKSGEQGFAAVLPNYLNVGRRSQIGDVHLVIADERYMLAIVFADAYHYLSFERFLQVHSQRRVACLNLRRGKIGMDGQNNGFSVIRPHFGNEEYRQKCSDRERKPRCVGRRAGRVARIDSVSLAKTHSCSCRVVCRIVCAISEFFDSSGTVRSARP